MKFEVLFDSFRSFCPRPSDGTDLQSNEQTQLKTKQILKANPSILERIM